MILKIFKAVWFLSLVGLLVSFLLVYASVPEQIVVQESSTKLRIVSRGGFFYGFLALFAMCNVLVFIMSSLYKRRSPDFMVWFYLLIISLNIFFVITLNFINVYNSSEKFNYQSIGNIIYGGVVLMVLVTLSWPVYLLVRKFSGRTIA